MRTEPSPDREEVTFKSTDFDCIYPMNTFVPRGEEITAGPKHEGTRVGHLFRKLAIAKIDQSMRIFSERVISRTGSSYSPLSGIEATETVLPVPYTIVGRQHFLGRSAIVVSKTGIWRKHIILVE